MAQFLSFYILYLISSVLLVPVVNYGIIIQVPETSIFFFNAELFFHCNNLNRHRYIIVFFRGGAPPKKTYWEKFTLCPPIF